MIYSIYVVRDLKTGFMTPTTDFNDASARRNFEHAVMQRNSLMYTHAEDYELFKIGQYDSDTGYIESQMPTMICAGTDVKIKVGEFNGI